MTDIEKTYEAEFKRLIQERAQAFAWYRVATAMADLLTHGKMNGATKLAQAIMAPEGAYVAIDSCPIKVEVTACDPRTRRYGVEEVLGEYSLGKLAELG